MAKIEEIEKKAVYIDPLTDFGFKRLFSDKVLMIDFLNSVLRLENHITQLHYGNTVRTGITKDDRSVIFDLYCTTSAGEHILVEMQTISHDNYKERTVYYATRLVQEQAKRGKEWNFALTHVYAVNIVNFFVDEHLTGNSYLSHIKLMYDDIKLPYYDKLTIVYLELPRFTLPEAELTTNIERWTYALKYLHELQELPSSLRTETFEKLFELARIAKLTKRQQIEYYKSLHDMSIVKATFNRQERDIAELQRDNTAKASTIATLQKELEAYRQMYGSVKVVKN
jgi:predicted transposase/invertase (TIGR01784 family)